MDYKERAIKLLTYYIKKTWPHDWTSDNDYEIEELVDDLIKAAKETNQ